ncbi:cache domain-containing protein [Paracoccus sp. (in: a-proteobacteria)]|uniref:cache domain-containing protein n=1 Tax=Paracoccus sp. TaxID=267 RepID=UPI003A838016
MRKSLGALLAICLAGLQFIAVLAVVFSSYLTSERVLLAHARKLMGDVGMNTAEHSRSFLSPAQDAAELAARLAQHRVVASEDPERLEQFLFQQLRITPQFSGLYYGGEDGSFIYVMRSDGPGPFRSKLIIYKDGVRTVDFIWRDENFQTVSESADPADTFDPRERPWYKSVVEHKATSWTEPYIFFSSQQPGITLAAPVTDHDGSLRGVIGVDIEISSISLFLSHLKIGEHGMALIVNRNGDVIAHPDQSLIKTRSSDGTLRFVSIKDLQDPLARAAFEAARDKNGSFPLSRDEFSEFTHDGKTYLSYIMPIISEQMPWTIAVYAPQDDFIGAIKRNRVQNIWIAATVALVTAAIGLLLANYIYRPVRAFAVRSALISQGEIDPSEPQPRTYRELEQANETLVQQIAARKNAEREYGQTFDLSGRAMAQVSPRTVRFLKVNHRLCELTGYSTVELLNMSFAQLLPKDEPLPENGTDLVADEMLSANREIRLRRKDGRILDVVVNSILIRDDRGQPQHAVVTLSDVSVSKAREGEIARLNRDLSHLARGNTMGQMAAGLAHELNQPLAAIAQNADTGLLIVNHADNSAPELREILQEIERESLRAGDIIRALRSFISKDETQTSDFSLAGLLDQAIRLVQAEAKEAHVLITPALPSLPAVRANRVQIAQVLVNLLRNAIEAIDSASSPIRRIWVRARVLGDLVEVEVRDTGPGVCPEVTLFAQFETTKVAGMGLGLSICRSIIEANGGELTLDREVAEGARFLFTLRIAS